MKSVNWDFEGVSHPGEVGEDAEYFTAMSNFREADTTPHIKLPHEVPPHILDMAFKPLPDESPKFSNIAQLLRLYEAFPGGRYEVETRERLQLAIDEHQIPHIDAHDVIGLYEVLQEEEFKQYFSGDKPLTNLEWLEELTDLCYEDFMTLPQWMHLLTLASKCVRETDEAKPHLFFTDVEHPHVSTSGFEGRFREFTFGVMEGFNWDGVVASGGAIHACLDTTAAFGSDTYIRSDLDLWILNSVEDRPAALAVMDRSLSFFQEKGAYFSVSGSAVVTAIIPGVARNVQIIFCDRDEWGVPLQFDLDYVQCLYNGSVVGATSDAVLAMISRVCRSGGPIRDDRVVKTVDKGFTFSDSSIYTPELREVEFVKKKLNGYYYPGVGETQARIEVMVQSLMTAVMYTWSPHEVLEYMVQEPDTIEGSDYLQYERGTPDSTLGQRTGAINALTHQEVFEQGRGDVVNPHHRHSIAPGSCTMYSRPSLWVPDQPFYFLTGLVFVGTSDFKSEFRTNLTIYIPRGYMISQLLHSSSYIDTREFVYCGHDFVCVKVVALSRKTAVNYHGFYAGEAKFPSMMSARLQIECDLGRGRGGIFPTLFILRASSIDYYPRSLCYNSLLGTRAGEKRSLMIG